MGPGAPPKCQRLRHPGLGAGRMLDFRCSPLHPVGSQVGGRWQREGRVMGWGRFQVSPHNSGVPSGGGKHSNTVLWTVDPGVQEKPGVGQKALA